MRSNLVIAMGDLAFRFPNYLEPWTAFMYKPLSDPDTGAAPYQISPSSCSAGVSALLMTT